MNQLIFKFPFKTQYFKQDFYVSKNNFSAYKLIEGWPSWPGKWLNIFGSIGSGKTHSVKDFLKIAFGLVNLDYKKFIKINKKFYRPNDKFNLVADFRKARRILKWKPKISFKSLVTEMVNNDISKPK